MLLLDLKRKLGHQQKPKADSIHLDNGAVKAQTELLVTQTKSVVTMATEHPEHLSVWKTYIKQKHSGLAKTFAVLPPATPHKTIPQAPAPAPHPCTTYSAVQPTTSTNRLHTFKCCYPDHNCSGQWTCQCSSKGTSSRVTGAQRWMMPFMPQPQPDAAGHCGAAFPCAPPLGHTPRHQPPLTQTAHRHPALAQVTEKGQRIKPYGMQHLHSLFFMCMHNTSTKCLATSWCSLSYTTCRTSEATCLQPLSSNAIRHTRQPATASTGAAQLHPQASTITQQCYPFRALQ